MAARIAAVVLLLAFATSVAQQPKLSVYTLTREDMFAGPLQDDMNRFQAGMEKLDEMLRENPKNEDALVMKGFGKVFLAVKALERGDRAGFDSLYSEGIGLMEQARSIRPNNLGVMAVYGATTLYFYPRLPAEQQPAALAKAKTYYEAMYRDQEKFIEKFPLHLKGELLGGLADVEYRLENREKAREYLERIVQTMPGTAYEAKARRWLEKPESVSKDDRLLCLSCHDPGRLKNRLAAAKQPGSQR